MARPALTLIYISRLTVVRADYRRGRSPVAHGFWEQPRPELPDLASVVEYGLSLGPKPGRIVWVVATDLWMQTLALPVAKVAGLNQDDLAQALGFEAESYSGMPAFDSSIGAVAFPPARGERVCWFTQIRSADRDAIAEAITRAGSRLAGLIHPGGIEQRLIGDPDRAFERLELWPDAVVGIRRGIDGNREVRVWNNDPPLNKWQADALPWFQSSPNELETLTAEGIPEPAARTAPVFSFDNAKSLQKWLAAWAEKLQAKSREFPAIPPPVRAMTAAARFAIALSLALFVAALCTAHSVYQNQQLQDLNTTWNEEKEKVGKSEAFGKLVDAKAAERDTLRTERTKLDKDLEKIRDAQSVVKADRQKADRELARLKSEREDIELGYVLTQAAATKEFERLRTSNLQELRRHRDRYSRLLHELSHRKPEDLVIQKIERNGDTLVVSGLSLLPGDADKFATNLTPILRECGWVTQPAKTSQNKRPDIDLYEFSIAIRDQVIIAEPSESMKPIAIPAGKDDSP